MPLERNSYKLGYINKMLPLPCAQEPSLWAGVAGAAALNLIWDVLTPDPKEAYHRLRGNSLVCDVKSTIAGFDFVPPEANSNATKFLFRSLEWYDRFTWYVFLLEAFHKGLINYASAAIKMHCDEGKGSPNYGSGPLLEGGLDYNGNWFEMIYNMNEGSRFYPAIPSQVTIPPSTHGIVAAHASFKTVDPTLKANIASRLINVTTGELYDFDTSELSYFTAHRTMVFHRIQNASDVPQTVSAQWSYVGPGSGSTTSATADAGWCTLYARQL